MTKTDFQWKKFITECLQSTDFCTIATVDNEGVWSNPVYFAWDNQFNLFFISQLHSRHMQNIRKNEKVSVSIYNTQQKGDVCGIQLEATAGILKDNLREIKNAYDVYYGRAGKGPDMQSYIQDPTWIFVKVTPQALYYFDTRFFKEERQLVPLEALRN